MLREAARPLWPVVFLLTALPACRGNDDPNGTGRTAPAGSVYLAVLAKRLEAPPLAKVAGVYRERNGCAMLNDDLLILPTGAAIKAGSGWAVRFGDNETKRLVAGYRVVGGGGYYPLAGLTASMNLATAVPVPARCAAVARQAVLVASVERIGPPSTYRDPLYVAVRRDNLVPPTLTPVSGTLSVVDQCLTLDGRLVALPAGSSAAFSTNGSLVVRITSSRYLQTVIAKPGDLVSGNGASLAAQGSLSPMPRPLVQPIPARCRPAVRGGVLLNPGPKVTPAGKTPYADPGSAEIAIVPSPSPPPPVASSADCPGGSRLAFGICRTPDGTAVPRSLVRSSPARGWFRLRAR